ncbi:MAG: DNA methyltransferase [Betaproteobacteria bacterium]
MADMGKISSADFIAKWSGVTASELSTAQSFAADLCRLLGVETPHPDAEQQYMFERPIVFNHGDGSTSGGRIDLYKRGCFVLEAKKLKAPTHTKGFDDALLRARSQAEGYARALPASEGRPPFLIVLDVGNRIELYAEFSRSGATYTPFPDPRSHRIALADLNKPEILERLRRIWSDPLSLDPSRESARVTREIAARLATLARSLEAAGHHPEAVAQFLMRCLFTMFAEDVKLLPRDSFRELLTKHGDKPDVAMRMLAQLWHDMDAGGFSPVIAADVLRFNGKLFKHPDSLPLDREQVALLLEAARADWKHVEPAIFGTLLERALDPSERHKLGAHYTPRAYVERLVLPTVIEPLRDEWSNAQAAALTQIRIAEEWRDKGGDDGKARSTAERLKQYQIELRKARDIVLSFHKRLCNVRVLDPACGSGNFLYVTLEHLKRLEGEVLNTLEEFGLRQLGVSAQTDLDMQRNRVISTEAETVDPHNLLGIELNPRAAAIAEVVLWIGYLQWHFRTHGDVNPPQPVIRDFRNIENRDAVLAYDRVEFVTDEHGLPVTRWDGKTMKKSPVTGENVPDDSARMPVERYICPSKAAWPAADFVVGNPPFIGKLRMRDALGDGYVEALRKAWPDVPDSADLVMHWWDHAASLVHNGTLHRFGLITTKSVSQTFNRSVLEKYMVGNVSPLSLVFAIPNHPWVDSAEDAAVRIAMTVGERGEISGRLARVVNESELEDGELDVELNEVRGKILPDLRIGADVLSARTLLANCAISNVGVIPHGEGFLVPQADRSRVDAALLRHFRNGRDLAGGRPREIEVIDTFNLSVDELRSKFPATYQWLHERVKPERDQNPRATRRANWWLFGENHPRMRESIGGLPRYICTALTSKHRTFFFVDGNILPDQTLVVTGSSDAFYLGVMSSEVHVVWALAAGGRLGVGNDPRYNKKRCFEPFPFVDPSDTVRANVRNIAEQLDSFRKRRQSDHPELTLTGIYNVLEKLRSGEVLSAKERKIHEQGAVLVVRQLHDELDAAVLDAYGWSDLLPLLRVAHANDIPGEGQTRDDAKHAFDDAILERLLALNAERAAEEARGLVRWLRPEFQNPGAQAKPVQDELVVAELADDDEASATVTTILVKPAPWPKDTLEQVRAVADVLSASPVPLSIEDVAARFTARGTWKKRLPQLLDTLVNLGRAREYEGRYSGR